MSLRFLSWLNEIFYAIALATIKISFLCLYRHIFSDTNFRRTALILIAIVNCACLASVLVIIFPCIPVSTSWAVHKGACIHSNAFAVSCAVINLIFDIVILALPIREVAKTNLPRATKIYVFVMFGTGGL